MTRPINPSVLLVVATLVCTAVGVAIGAEAPAIPAFPGAEGAGAQTVIHNFVMLGVKNYRVLLSIPDSRVV